MGAAIRAEDCLNRRTLIVGDVNTGKTTLSARVLAEMVDLGRGGRIAVVDLSPDIPPGLAEAASLSGIGGRLTPPPGSEALYLKTDIVPPRLSSRSEVEAIVLARRNFSRIEELFERFEASGRDILFVNDLSLYLQAGSAKALAGRLDKAATVVANGYYGERLGRGALSEHERAEMEAMMAWADRVVRLSPAAGR